MIRPFQPGCENAEGWAQECEALSDILMIMQDTIVMQYRAKDACAKAEQEAVEAVCEHSEQLCRAWRTLAMRYDRAALVKYNGHVDTLVMPNAESEISE